MRRKILQYRRSALSQLQVNELRGSRKGIFINVLFITPINIVAPELTVENESEKIIEVPPKEYSERISFQLTPKQSGTHGIMINVSDEYGVSVGELPVETNVDEQVKPSVREATIVVFTLNVLVNLVPARKSQAKGYAEPMVDEKNTRHEKVTNRLIRKRSRRKIMYIAMIILIGSPIFLFLSDLYNVGVKPKNIKIEIVNIEK